MNAIFIEVAIEQAQANEQLVALLRFPGDPEAEGLE